MNQLFACSELKDIIAKVEDGNRLSFEDGVRLFRTQDLLAVGYMADLARRRRNGDRTYFSSNRHGNDTNICATMLYGHGETIEERVDHLLRLRELQDRTGGFLSFAPCAFHPKNTALEGQIGPRQTTGFDDLKVLAVARLLLDNFGHIKAFWLQIGLKLAQVSLAFGVDDLDGTVIEEQITHAAGAGTGHALTKEQLVKLIKGAGFKPVERDTLYNVLREF